MTTAMTLEATRHSTKRAHTSQRAAGPSALVTALGHMSRELRGPLSGLAILIELVDAERSARGAHASSSDGASVRDSRQALEALRLRVLERLRETGDPLGYCPKLIDFCDVVLAAVRLSWPLAESRGVTLVCSSTPPTITSGDSALLVEAIDTLVSRIVRASPAGSIVTCHVSEAGGELVARITSTAPDIDLSALQSRLRPFERGPALQGQGPTERQADLWTARLIAERHGGRVHTTMQSQQGRASVELRIPISWG